MSATPQGPASSNGFSKKRRARHHEGEDKKSARRKVHPFFTKRVESAQPDTSEFSTFRWVNPPLGDKRTCLYGINLEPKNQAKVAFFDLDGTLIKYFHTTAAKMDSVWEWWRGVVPSKLKELHDAGYSIVIMSNQAIKPAFIEPWKKKISFVAAALTDVPFRIFAATAKDGYRKPMLGMLFELEQIYRRDDIYIDTSDSFFVGDAAGRPGDYSSTDRKWAENAGISFYTPEEHFLRLPATAYSLPGFHVSSLTTPRTPSSMPLVTPSGKPELVVFVGYPCLGKSTFFRRYFAPHDYEHINQDTLGSRANCIRAVERALSSRRSCVVDNTNRDVWTRKQYIEVARQFNIPVRCYLFTGSMNLAWHNNLYRAYNLPPSVAAREPRRSILPHMAFSGFRDHFQEPQISEGFREVNRVDWVFDGDDEERRYWSMWLQIDGK